MLGAGIRVTRWDSDWRAVDVEMKLRFWNANFVSTHYGGSLYSMVDPFYMLMLIENLDSEYIVWDKAATIRFRRPRKGTVFAKFRLKQERIDQIRQILTSAEKMEPMFVIEIKDASGTVVAEVEKVLSIRKKSGRSAVSA